MKNTRRLLSALCCVLMLFAFAACNNASHDATAPDVSGTSLVGDGANQEIVAPSDTDSDGKEDTPDVSYTADSDELEIMTHPQGEDDSESSDKNTGDSQGSDKGTSPEPDGTKTEEEGFPGEYDGPVIELPFVPAE